MKRAEELRKIFSKTDEDVQLLVYPYFDRVAFLERQLAGLEGLPAAKRGSREWARRHKECAAQLDNIMRILLKALGKAETVEISPLREYLEKMRDR